MRTWLGGMVVTAMLALLLGGALWMLTDRTAAATPDLEAPGSLNVIVKPGEKLISCPLEHTEVEGWITGDVAHVRVTQRFGNPYDSPIEAVYAFPLPENAAVDDMVMQVGDRTVRGVIKRREEAKQVYEQAKQQGKTASLLEQERPNLFTQSVANIRPGDRIETTIWYVQDLKYDRGRYSFVFPMVVGPRYIPGTPTGQQAGGWSPDTDQVPDASRITPPVLRPEERTGHDIALTLHLDAGVPAYDLACKSHDTDIGSFSGQAALVKLAPHDTLPNKDFDLSWRVAGERPEVGVISYRDDRSGYFTLLLQPKESFDQSEITPKEMVFCLDTSGSMMGLPIEKSKQVVTRCLQEMGPQDTFQIVRFAGDSATFAPKPVPATPANIAQATEFIDGFQGGGGTEMLKGIEASLGFPANPNQIRIVAFLTDGYIGNETEILARIEEKLGEARIFSFGIGSSVNRYLLTKMAQAGRGTAQFVRQNEDPDEAVAAFVERVARPYLTNLEIDWGGLQVADLYPAYLPDLFADQPVILHGRYEQPGEGEITIRGEIAGQPWETTEHVVFAREEQPEDAAIATLWARASIEDMTDQMYGGEKKELVEAITDLALAYRLMSPYTSFVAVEERVVNQGGKQATVQVPVPAPEGVEYEGVFGEADALTSLGYIGTGSYALKSAGVAASAQAAVVAPRGYGGGGGAGGGRAGGGARGGGALRPPAAPPPILKRVEELGSVGPTRDLTPDTWMAVLCTDPGASRAPAARGLKSAAQASIGVPEGPVVAGTPADLGGPTDIAPLDSGDLDKVKALRILVLTGSGRPDLGREATAALARFVRRGGFLIVDCAGDDFYRITTNTLVSLLPEAEFRRISDRHAIFQGASMPFKITGGCPIVRHMDTSGPAQGLFLGDRLAVFVSRGDLCSAWAMPETRETGEAYRMGANLVAYGLQGGGRK